MIKDSTFKNLKSLMIYHNSYNKIYTYSKIKKDMIKMETLEKCNKLLESNEWLPKFKPYAKEQGSNRFIEGITEYELDVLELVRIRKTEARRYIKDLINNPKLWLIDYTAMSCTTLKLKKNRYLLNKNGLYFIKGYVIALNPCSKRKLVLETDKTQLTLSDINEISNYIRKIDSKALIVSDKRHTNILNTTKILTQLIENTFGGFKTHLYKQLEAYQQYVKNYVVTNISFNQLEELYRDRFNKLGYEIIKKVKPKIENKKL